MTDQHRTLDDVIAHNLARLRQESRGERAEDVARAMDALGFSWTRQTVTAIERGNRRLRIEEFLGLAGHWKVSLGEFFRGQDGEIATAGDTCEVNLDRLAGELSMVSPVDAFARSRSPVTLEDVNAQLSQLPPEVAASIVQEFFRDHPEVFGPPTLRPDIGLTAGDRLLLKAVPNLSESPATLSGLSSVLDRAPSEADKRAAAACGVTALEIMVTSQILFGQSLDDERDQRVSAKADGDDDPSALRARRGHVSRALHEELGEALINRGTR